jgi:TonB family protein
VRPILLFCWLPETFVTTTIDWFDCLQDFISLDLNGLRFFSQHFCVFPETPSSWHCTCLFLVGIVSLAQEAEVRTRGGWWKKLITGAAIFALVGSLSGAQQAEEGKRKTKTKVNPTYPDLARRMNISGRVKIEVVIAPDGHVKSSRAVGGHPVLVQPCLDAVREWRFEAAPEETTQLIEFSFSQ